MKNFTFKIILSALLMISFVGFAQIPQKMSYQSVIRNATGELLTNTNIGIQISILKDSPTGTAVYVESMTNQTNENGLLSIEIGGGTPSLGTFSAIDWATGTYFVKTETDPNGGSNYSIVGTGQLLSVPYALFSARSTNLGKTTIILTDDITDGEAATQLENEIGSNTENIYITDTTQLTTLNLTGLKSVINIYITNNLALTTVLFSDLQKIYKDVAIIGNPILNSLTFPVLARSYSGSFLLKNNFALSSIQFPLLTKLLTITFEDNTALDSIGFPSLTSFSSMVFNNNAIINFTLPLVTTGNISLIDTHTTNFSIPSMTSGSFGVIAPITSIEASSVINCTIQLNNTNLTSISFPNLTSCETVSLENNSQLTAVDLPVLTNCIAYINVKNNSQLNSFAIPSLSVLNPTNSNYSYYFVVSNNAFPASIINSFLNKLLTLNAVSGKTIDLSGQNPPAPPTGQGINDKLLLINNGFNVLTD